MKSFTYSIYLCLSDSLIPSGSIHTVTNGKISFLMAEEYFTVYMYTPGANSLVAQLVKKKTCLQCRRLGFSPWVRKIPWRRKRQPTLVLVPGKFHGPRSLAGYSPWGRKSRTQLSNRTTTNIMLLQLQHSHGVYISGQRKVDKLRPINYVVSRIDVSSTENSAEQGGWVEGEGKGSVVFMECSGRFDELSVFNCGPERGEETNVTCDSSKLRQSHHGPCDVHSLAWDPNWGKLLSKIRTFLNANVQTSSW